jgi:hypothetical protein
VQPGLVLIQHQLLWPAHLDRQALQLLASPTVATAPSRSIGIVNTSNLLGARRRYTVGGLFCNRCVPKLAKSGAELQNLFPVTANALIWHTVPNQMSRREIFLWLVGCLLANHVLHIVSLVSFEAFITSLMSLNLIYAFACYVVLQRIFESDPDAPASRLDVAAALALGAMLCLSSLVGYRFGVGVLATMAAVYILATCSADVHLKAAGAVLLALSAHLVWGPIFFQMFTPELLRADAALVGELLSVASPDIIWSGTKFTAPSGHSISLVGSCSSFMNVSIALLASVSMTMRRRTWWVRRDIVSAFAVCAAMIALNTVRVAALALNAEVYQFWHVGIGVPIIALGQTVVIVIMAYTGANWADRVVS